MRLHSFTTKSSTVVATILAIASCVVSPKSNLDEGTQTDTTGDSNDTSVPSDTENDSILPETAASNDTLIPDESEDGTESNSGEETSNSDTSVDSTSGDTLSTDSTTTESGDSSTGSTGSEESTDNGTAGDTSSDTDDCPSVSVNFATVTPTVVLLIDQSGSMKEDLQPMLERWDAVGNALFDPTDGIVTTLENEIRFGMQLYTSDDGTMNGKECPLLTGDVPAIGNHANLSNIFSSNTYQEDTPTGDSIAVVAADLASDPNEGPKIIVLATDGEPDSCAIPDPDPSVPQELQSTQDLAVQATQQAYSDGISTFIISVGSAISDDHLQDMANAGAGEPTDTGTAPFYRATDQNALIDAFEEIINGVRSCVFTLDGEIVAGSEDKGVVRLNNQELTIDDPNGWQVVSSTEIELLGDSCHSIKEGTVEIDIEFPCDTIIPQ